MAGTSSGARKGWETRRALAAATEAARATSRVAGKPPGAGRAQRTRDGAVVWAAPRSPEGRVEPQVALGGGSVSRDMVTREGAHLSRTGVHAALEDVQGLRTVSITYHLSDADDSEESQRRTTHRVTVDFGRYTTTRQRELAIARVVQDHARSLRYTKDGVSQIVTVSLVRVGEPIQRGESRAPQRHDRKPKGGTRSPRALAQAVDELRAPKPPAKRKPASKRKPRGHK